MILVWLDVRKTFGILRTCSWGLPLLRAGPRYRPGDESREVEESLADCRRPEAFRDRPPRSGREGVVPKP